MLKHINSLVAFTLLAQSAVGLYFILLSGTLLFPAFFEPAYTLVQSLCLIMSLIALGFSFTHLGYPMHALFALKNTGSSWLSREILFLTLWILLLIMEHILLWANPGSTPRDVIQWLTILTGLLLIYSMAKLYMLRTLPGWRKAYTPLNFFQTALLSGQYIVLLLLLLKIIKDQEGNLLLITALNVTILMLLGWGIRIFAPLKKRKRTPGLMLVNAYGALLLGWLFIYDPNPLLHIAAIILLPLSFLLTIISMVLERKNFYANFEKHGV